MPAVVSQQSVSGHQIEVTAKRVRQTFQRQLRESKIDVTVDQWVLLQALGIKEGISQLQLSQSVFKDQPSVTRILDLMDEKKLITRNADQSDRRKFLIFLTPYGKKVIRKIEPLVQEFREKVFAGINKSQLDQFQKTLNIIFNNLD